MAAATIEEYVAGLTEEGRRYCEAFSGHIARHYPQLHGKICFAMPMWLAGTKMREGYVAFSAAQAYFSIHFSREDFVRRLSARLPACRAGKRCVSIRYGDDASFAVVKASLADFFPENR